MPKQALFHRKQKTWTIHLIPITEQLCLCSAATAELYLANLCFLPKQVRVSWKPTPVIPGTHILCQCLEWVEGPWEDSLSYPSSEQTTNEQEEQISSYCHALGKKNQMTWHSIPISLSHHATQLSSSDRGRGQNTFQSTQGICSSFLYSITQCKLSTDATHCSWAAAPKVFLTRKSVPIYNVW